MKVIIREFREPDAPEVNRIAVAAFSEFADGYTDWPVMRDRIATTSRLAGEMPFFVAVAEATNQAAATAQTATAGEIILGAVGYTPPFGPRPDFFEPDAVIIRMLVVDPARRGPHGSLHRPGAGRRRAADSVAYERSDEGRTADVLTPRISMDRRAARHPVRPLRTYAYAFKR